MLNYAKSRKSLRTIVVAEGYQEPTVTFAECLSQSFSSHSLSSINSIGFYRHKMSNYVLENQLLTAGSRVKLSHREAAPLSIPPCDPICEINDRYERLSI